MTGAAPLEAPPGGEPERVFLMAGSIHVASRPTVISTILGSCIAVCLWDSRRKVGGMNHFLLPRGHGGGGGRYGDVAIERLVHALGGLGCRPADLEAKLFGGAAVLRPADAAATVGEANLKMALDCLRGKGIRVVARRTGGERGLLVRFDTATGEALVRPIAGSDPVPSRPHAAGRPLCGGKE